MAVKKKKYYVVWVGKTPGIYDDWKDCQAQISGFPNAKYKAFPDQEQAREAFRDTYSNHYSQGVSKPSPNYRQFMHEIILDSLCVDAACSGNPGLMEYRAVKTDSRKEVFRIGPLEDGTNNVGEFLAIVHALALFEKEGKSNQVIYTDSRTAMKWVSQKKAKTKLVMTKKNDPIFVLIERAQNWLQTHSWDHQILKWQTDRWGEIPADFGRK